MAISRWAVVGLACVSVAFAGASRGDDFNPTPDPRAKRGYYIPKDLGDSIRELDKALGPEVKSEIANLPNEEGVNDLHEGLGSWMRRHWLFAGSRLRKHFAEMDLESRDELSTLLLRAYWRHLKGEDINATELVEQARYFQEAVREPPPTRCPSGAESELRVLFGTSRGEKYAETRIFHMAICPADGSLWRYEYGKGWQPASADERAHVQEYLSRK